MERYSSSPASSPGPVSPRATRSGDSLYDSGQTTPHSPLSPRSSTSELEDSQGGGFWRRLKKKVAEPFVVGRKTGSSPTSRDNSQEVATLRMREAHEEENNKTRIKDIIRRDLLFYPTFRNALQGNSERTGASLRYSELYERYKDLYAPLLYDDPGDSDWGHDVEDSLFLTDGYDLKRAASLFGVSRQTIPSEVAEADLNWAKSKIEDKEIADELAKMQKKLRERNEIYVLLTAAKRQVLGAGFKTVRWEQKSSRELAELFGSEDRAREVQKMDGTQKGRVLTSVKAQIKELAKYQEEIAHHYAFCQEVLKRASDAPQIDSLVLKLRSIALAHRDEWTAEIGRELAKRKDALEKEQQQERDRERQRELEKEEEERQHKANSPRGGKSGEEDAAPEETNAQTRQEESLLYELSSKARAAMVEPPPSPVSPVPASALKRLLNLEAGGSLHLPKMMAIDFSGEDYPDSSSRPSLQQDEGEEEAALAGATPLITSNQHKFVSVRKTQRKPSLNELFIIGKRESTINRSISPDQGATEASTNAPTTTTEAEGKEKDEELDEKDTKEENEEDKTEKTDEEEDFIIVFKYGGKAYRCNEKEKSILERQVKVLDPSTFQMLLDDFQLVVFAVLDEPQQQEGVDAQVPAKSEDDDNGGGEGKKSEEEESDEEEEKEEGAEGEDEKDAEAKDESENAKLENGNRNRRRRRRRGRRRKAQAGASTPQKNEATTPQKKEGGQAQGVELGGRVWTKSPASPFSPSKRANCLAEKNNTMRDTMRQRMQLAYEEEVNKRGEQKLQWKRKTGRKNAL